MIRLALLLLFLVAPAYAVDTCVECHAAQSAAGLSRQTTQVAQDVHGQAGVSCHHCHGGDPTTGMDMPDESMDQKKGYIGVPKPAAIAAVCAKCHSDPKFMRDHAPTLPTDQPAKYALSLHAQSAIRNEKHAATCTACHRAHGILPASDPRSTVNAAQVPATCGRCHADPAMMAPKNLPSDVVRDYTASVHWRAVKSRNDRAAPVCHDCHGNHAAATPAPAAVVNLCGRCHTAERAAFAQGKHAGLPGFRGCVECHSNHKIDTPTDAFLAPTGVCSRCHRDPGPALLAARDAYGAYTALDADIAAAATALEPLKAQALPTHDAEEALAAARQALIAARRLIHTDSPAARAVPLEQAQTALAQATAATAAAAAERDTRRTAPLAFALLALLTSLTLAAKVHELSKEPSADRLVDEHAPTPASKSKPRKRKNRR